MSNGSLWPCVSIVTPSYNQGRFIEETIRSVLLQGYPDVEYLIIDGGSTDESISIIHKYADWLSYWASEPDMGQSDAINKGFRRARGEIVAWLNSDDTYVPGAIRAAVDFLVLHPNVAMVYGDYNLIDEHSKLLFSLKSRDFDLAKELSFPNLIPQPTVFFRRTVLEKVGYLNTSLHFAFDYDFWIRAGLQFRIHRIPGIVANFRTHTESKSVSQMIKFWPETFEILDKTFASSATPECLRKLKHKAYSNVYLGIGKEHYTNGRMAESRKALSRSVTLDPLQLARSNLLFFWITSLFGARFATALFAARKRQLSCTSIRK